MWKHLSILFLFFFGHAASGAASFDCATADTPVRTAICSSAWLNAADATMGDLYRGVLAAATASEQNKIQAEQLEWLTQLNNDCYPSPGRNLDQCIQYDEDIRIGQLQALPIRLSGVTFTRRSVKVTVPIGSPRSDEKIDDNGTGTIKADWPSAKSDSPEWRAWNIGIEAALQRMASGRKITTTTRWHASWAIGSRQELRATIEFLGPNLVTALIKTDLIENGGAHEFQSRFNWLLKQKRELTAADVFRTDTDWKHFIESRSESELSAELADNHAKAADASDIELLRKNVVRPENWQIEGQGLAIAFNVGAIVCEACPVGPVTIPWPDLKPYLVPSFQLPPALFYAPSW